MLLDVCFGTRTAWKILLVFSEAPGKAISRKEIQKLTKMGNKTLSKFLLLLEKFEMLSSRKIGKSYYYQLQLGNPFAVSMLEIMQLEKKALHALPFPVLNILREFVYELTNANLENLNKVILFGSYAKRTASIDSDIDVALLFKEKSPDDELLVTDIIDRLKKRFKAEIQPHYYAAKEFEALKKKNKLAQEIVKDGIVLM